MFTFITLFLKYYVKTRHQLQFLKNVSPTRAMALTFKFYKYYWLHLFKVGYVLCKAERDTKYQVNILFYSQCK